MAVGRDSDWAGAGVAERDGQVSRGVIDGLRESRALLQAWVDEGQLQGDRLARVRLWCVRLTRVLARQEPGVLADAGEHIVELLEMPVSAGLECEIRFEALRCAAAGGERRMGSFAAQFDQVEKWLRNKAGELDDHAGWLLEFCLLREVLLRERRAGEVVSDSVGIRCEEWRLSIAGRRLLEELTTENPRLRPAVVEVVGGRLDGLLNGAGFRAGRELGVSVESSVGAVGAGREAATLAGVSVVRDVAVVSNAPSVSVAGRGAAVGTDGDAGNMSIGGVVGDKRAVSNTANVRSRVGVAAAWDGCLGRLSDFEVVCLVRYYRALGFYAGALRVCDGVLRGRLVGDVGRGEGRGQVLYEAGLCHYRLGGGAESVGQAGGRVEELAGAVEQWERLARECVGWSDVWDPDRINAEWVAWMAAATGYRLFADDGDRYGSLAERALGALIGEVGGANADVGMVVNKGHSHQVGRVSLAGPYADGRRAREYRYCYGRVLLARGRYAAAEVVFKAVAAGDEHEEAAVYYAVLAGVRQHEASGDNYSGEVQQKWIGELTRLLDRPEGVRNRAEQQQGAARDDDEIRGKAVVLLGEVCLGGAEAMPGRCLAFLERYGGSLVGDVGLRVLRLRVKALEMLGRGDEAVRTVLADAGWESVGGEMARVAANLLVRLRGEFLRDHAEGDGVGLHVRLREAGELAERIASVDARADVGETALFDQAVLEALSLASVSARRAVLLSRGLSAEDSGLQRWLVCGKAAAEAFRQRRAGAQKVFWFVRCEALLSYAQGDYERSRRLWRQVRLATAGSDDEWQCYYWWEARVFSLYCLKEQGLGEQIGHVIEVSRRTGPVAGAELWRGRLDELERDAAKGNE